MLHGRDWRRCSNHRTTPARPMSSGRIVTAISGPLRAERVDSRPELQPADPLTASSPRRYSCRRRPWSHSPARLLQRVASRVRFAVRTLPDLRGCVGRGRVHAEAVPAGLAHGADARLTRRMARQPLHLTRRAHRAPTRPLAFSAQPRPPPSPVRSWRGTRRRAPMRLPRIRPGRSPPAADPRDLQPRQGSCLECGRRAGTRA